MGVNSKSALETLLMRGSKGFRLFNPPKNKKLRQRFNRLVIFVVLTIIYLLKKKISLCVL